MGGAEWSGGANRSDAGVPHLVAGERVPASIVPERER